MTDAYHKARSHLVLFSGILISWEYLKITLFPPPVNGSNRVATGKVLGVPFEIQHAEVIPIVIIILVLYFGIRLGIEWSQCDREQCDLPASQIDMLISYLLGTFSIVIFLFQRYLEVQLGSETIVTLAMAALLGGGLVPIFFILVPILVLNKFRSWLRLNFIGRLSLPEAS